MNKASLIAVSLLTAGNFLGAILPPFWESVRELEGVLRNPDLKEYFDSGDTILSIERAPGGLLISTQTKDVWVNVTTKPMEHPGPVQYQYQFDKARPCQSKNSKSSG